MLAHLKTYLEEAILRRSGSGSESGRVAGRKNLKQRSISHITKVETISKKSITFAKFKMVSVEVDQDASKPCIKIQQL